MLLPTIWRPAISPRCRQPVLFPRCDSPFPVSQTGLPLQCIGEPRCDQSDSHLLNQVSCLYVFPDLKVTGRRACRHFRKVCVVKAPVHRTCKYFNTEGLFDEEDDDDTDPIIE